MRKRTKGLIEQGHSQGPGVQDHDKFTFVIEKSLRTKTKTNT